MGRDKARVPGCRGTAETARIEVYIEGGYIYMPRTSNIELLRRQIWPAPMAIFTNRC